MSSVTNVIITCSVDNQRGIDALNKLVCPHVPGFIDIGELPGPFGLCTAGGKRLEATILVGAFNYLADDLFLDQLKTCPWRGYVHVLLQRQHEDTFSTLWLGLFE